MTLGVDVNKSGEGRDLQILPSMDQKLIINVRVGRDPVTSTTSHLSMWLNPNSKCIRTDWPINQTALYINKVLFLNLFLWLRVSLHDFCFVLFLYFRNQIDSVKKSWVL